MPEVEPVFRNFFKLFVDQGIRSGGSLVSVNDVQFANFSCSRKSFQIDDGFFCKRYGLILQRVIDRQPVFGSEIYTRRPTMPFAMPAVILNSLVEQFIRR